MEKYVDMDNQVEITITYLDVVSGDEITESHVVEKTLYNYILSMRNEIDGKRQASIVSYSLN